MTLMKRHLQTLCLRLKIQMKAMKTKTLMINRISFRLESKILILNFRIQNKNN
jgi:hypothetical protein